MYIIATHRPKEQYIFQLSPIMFLFAVAKLHFFSRIKGCRKSSASVDLPEDLPQSIFRNREVVNNLQNGHKSKNVLYHSWFWKWRMTNFFIRRFFKIEAAHTYFFLFNQVHCVWKIGLQHLTTGSLPIAF